MGGRVASNGFSGCSIPAFQSWFSYHISYNCGKGGTTTCLITVVECRQGHAPGKTFFLNNSSFCISLILLRSQGFHKYEVNLATLGFGNIARFKTVVSVCQGGYTTNAFTQLLTFNRTLPSGRDFTLHCLFPVLTHSTRTYHCLCF